MSFLDKIFKKKENKKLDFPQNENPVDIKSLIKDVNDFPKPGIVFKDITPIFTNPAALKQIINKFVEFVNIVKPDVIVGVESRGFLFGTPLALQTNLPFVLVRKPNKLPRETVSVSYSLEYGESTIQMHKDSIKPNQRVLIIDDLLATGGTVQAVEELVTKLGGVVVGNCFLIELLDLNGKNKLKGDIFSLIQY